MQDKHRRKQNSNKLRDQSGDAYMNTRTNKSCIGTCRTQHDEALNLFTLTKSSFIHILTIAR